MEFLEFLKEKPVIGILRDIPMGSEESCIQVSLACGLKAIEVTMNTEGAKEIIKSLRKKVASYDIMVGAGTVRHQKDLELAIAAGAEFIITPNTRKEIIRYANAAAVPIIPGALTPTEIQKAYDLGANAVKVFPVNCVGGVDYIKALRGPFRDIPLMACGGVNSKNAKEYLNAGADLLSFGASIFHPNLMKSGNWEEIEKNLKNLLDSIS